MMVALSIMVVVLPTMARPVVFNFKGKAVDAFFLNIDPTGIDLSWDTLLPQLLATRS